VTSTGARTVIRNALLGGIVAAVVLSLLYGAAELVFRSQDWEKLAVDRQYPKGYFTHDAFGMAKPAPGEWEVVTKSTDTGKIVYDVRYTVDQFGLRATPVSNPEGRDRFALFFGCSYTYGEGLPDDETLPHDFGEIAPRYRPYNYGFHGGGPFEALARMEHVDFDVEVPEKSGIGVYLYIDDHVRRVNNTSTVARWHSGEILYTQTADGRFVSDGSFAQARPWETWLRRFVSNQRVLRYLNVQLPLRIGSKHFDLTALALAEVARRFEARFPGSEFYVAIYPGMVWSEPIGKRLVRHGVHVLDYSKLFKRDTPGYRIAADGHPTAAANRELAAALARDVERDDAARTLMTTSTAPISAPAN
jgi:hypothetical protein